MTTIEHKRPTLHAIAHQVSEGVGGVVDTAIEAAVLTGAQVLAAHIALATASCEPGIEILSMALGTDANNNMQAGNTNGAIAAAMDQDALLFAGIYIATHVFLLHTKQNTSLQKLSDITRNTFRKARGKDFPTILAVGCDCPDCVAERARMKAAH